MKYSILILVGCALAVSPLGAEEEKKPDAPKRGGEAGKGRPGQKGGRPDGSFFKELDKNDDKAISKEEAGERWNRLSKLDKNEDGKVTGQEMMAARGGNGGRPPGPGGRGAPGEMFKRADKNEDGKLTKDEVPERAWAYLSKLDKNNDNAVSAEEAKAGRPPGGPGGPRGAEKGRGEEFFKRADKNEDGKLSKDELPEQAWERMSKLDKDNDNAISKKEMAAGMAAMRGGKGKGPGGKGGPPTGGPGAVFERFDKNKDDKLSESEVPGEMWSKLRKADTDADGTVSKKELGKVYADRESAGKGEKPERKDGEKPARKRPELEKPAA